MGPLSGHLWEPFIGPFERSSNYNPSETCLFQAIYGGLQLQPHLYCVCAHLASPPKLWSSILESCQPPRRFLCPRSATKPLSRTGGSPSAFKLDSCPLIFFSRISSRNEESCVIFSRSFCWGRHAKYSPLGISEEKTWFADRLVSTPALLIWITSQSLSPELLWAPSTAGRKKWRSGAFLLDRWGASRYSTQGAFSLDKSVYKRWGTCIEGELTN